MKFNVAMIALLMVVIFTYAIGFTGKPFLFVIFLNVALSAAFFTIYSFIINLIWKLLPDKIKLRNEKHKKRFSITILICVVLFLFGGWEINHYYLPGKFSLMSIVGNFMILLFTILIGWSLIKPKKKRIIWTSIIGIVLFFIVFAFAHLKTQKIAISSSSRIEVLKSLPYLSNVVEDKNIDKDGVTIYRQNLCNEGINIYNSVGIAGAYLLNLSGNILHTWLPEKSHSNWHYVEMYDQGDLLVIIKDRMLMRLDWNSNIKWSVNMRFHHDIAFDENKDIYALSRKDELVFHSGLPMPILNDYIIVLTPQGKIKKEISLYKILKSEIIKGKLADIYHWLIMPRNIIMMMGQERKFKRLFSHSIAPDIFHTNTIELINNDINSIFKKGNILFCSKVLNLIGVINIKSEKLLWSWGTNCLERPHHPTLLANGNILVFDNGTKRNSSRVLELNPITGKIVWRYEAIPPESFFSSWGGSNQRLPNGNTLITDSANGRIFEITKDGKIVWEFFNPIKDKKGRRATIYRMMRITEPKKILY